MTTPADGDPFALSPASRPASVSAAVGTVVSRVLMLMTWVLVGVIELVDVPNESVGVFIVPAFEAAIWIAAVAATIYVVSQVRRGMPALAVLVVVIGGSTFVYFTNWSAFEPRSYFAVHRPGFARVADLVHQGTLGTPDDP